MRGRLGVILASLSFARHADRCVVAGRGEELLLPENKLAGARGGHIPRAGSGKCGVFAPKMQVLR